MKDVVIAFSAAAFLLAAAVSGFAADASSEGRGTLLFQDDFERDESDPQKEELGQGWTTNSRSRAKGNKQVDLQEGAMRITRHPVADHGVAIFHPVAFRDGTVQLRFKLGKGDDLGIDFVDRELKSVHAGHLCIARITLNRLTLTDSKTGQMDLEMRNRRLEGTLTPEQTAFLKTKTVSFPLQLDAEEWHTLSVTVEGNVMRASVDGEPGGEFQSEGIGHPTKRMITLAVNKTAMVDDVKIWKLK